MSVKKILIFGSILVLICMTFLPAIQGEVINSNSIREPEESNLGATRISIKVCYLECLDNLGRGDGYNKGADFYWRIKVGGGIDDQGSDVWKQYLPRNNQILVEHDLEKIEGNPHSWDISRLSEVPIYIELFDIDLYRFHDDKNMLDINDKIDQDDGYGYDNSMMARFYLSVDSGNIDFLDSGGEYVEFNGGSIEFNGKGRDDDRDDWDAIIRIKIWIEDTNHRPSIEVTHPKNGFLYSGLRPLFPISVLKVDAILLGSNIVTGTFSDPDDLTGQIVINMDSNYFDTVDTDENGEWQVNLPNGLHSYEFIAVDPEESESLNSVTKKLLIFA